MRNKLHKLMGNLAYVTIDPASARAHWWDMVGFSGLDPATYCVNREVVLSQKAVAGILGHRQSRNFVIHRLRERALLRRVAEAKAEQELNLPVYQVKTAEYIDFADLLD